MLRRVSLGRRWPLFASLGIGLLMALAFIVASRVVPASAQAASDVTISKTADSSFAYPGKDVLYTITFANSGSVSYSAVMSDIIPYGVNYVPGSVSPPATYVPGPPARIEWSGTLAPGNVVVVTFHVLVVQPGTSGPLPILNTACIRYGAFRRCTAVTVYSSNRRLYLPIVMKNAEGTPPWPWVQPGSRR